MKSLLKLVCMSILLTLSATSCTKTDLEETYDEQVEVFATEGDDEEIKLPPSER